MPRKIVVYWRDIPAQVIIKQGRKTAKRQLDERFEKAIDMAAMRAQKRDTDSYLEEWRKADEGPLDGDDLEKLADRAASEIEALYDEARLRDLVANHGREGDV